MRRAGAWIATLLLMSCVRDAEQPAPPRNPGAGPPAAGEQDAGTAVQPVEWRVDSQPLVVIGAEPIAGHDLFQVHTAIGLSDGRILVANGNPSELRSFAPDGRFVGVFARAGEGPGEFRLPSTLAIGTDGGVLGYDPLLQRLSYFDGAGRYLQDQPFSSHDWSAPAIAITALGNGDLLAVDIVRRMPIDPVTAIRTDSVAVVRYRAADSSAVVVTRRLGPSLRIERSGRSESAWVHPLEPGVVVAADSDRTFIADAASGRIEVFDHLRDSQRLFADPHPGPPLTPELWNRVVEQAVGWSRADALARNRAAFAAMPKPDRLPAVVALRVDTEGLLWSSAYPLPGAIGVDWEVRDAQGMLVARASLPAGFVPAWITRDRIVGIWRDPAVGEQVWVLRLHRARQ